MATGGYEESEDSSYMSVTGESAYLTRESKDKTEKSLRTGLIAVKAINKNLNERNNNLQKDIENQAEENNLERKRLVQNHKREIIEKSREIENLKSQISKLKDIIKEKEKKEKAEKDERNGSEQEMLEITSYKEEIKILRDQVAMLKKKMEVLEGEIIEEKLKSVDLLDKFKNFSEKQEEQEKTTKLMNDKLDNITLLLTLGANSEKKPTENKQSSKRWKNCKKK